jgi:hypothetical protein
MYTASPVFKVIPRVNVIVDAEGIVVSKAIYCFALSAAPFSRIEILKVEELFPRLHTARVDTTVWIPAPTGP